MATLAELNNELAALQAELQQVSSQLAELISQSQALEFQGNRGTQYQQIISQIESLRAQRAALDQEIARLQVRINQLLAVEPEVNSGPLVLNAQDARDEGSLYQNPPQSPIYQNDDDGFPDVGPSVLRPTVGPSDEPAFTRVIPTNAEFFVADDDIGVEGRLRPGSETQSIPPPTAPYPLPSTLPEPGSDPDNAVPPGNPDDYYNSDPWGTLPETVAAVKPGVVSESDDAAGTQNLVTETQTQTGTQAGDGITNLANKTARTIVPRSNILDQFSSYTYSISIYLMSPEDYRRLLDSGKKYIPGYQLLMQSGGAPQFAAGSTGLPDDFEPGGVSLAQGRNQFFPLDYYIEDVEIKSVVNGKGTGAAHNAVDLRFKIIEPAGITLLDNLYKACQQYVTRGGGGSQSVKNANYAAQNYLMVIRFYGYDENGNIKTRPSADPTSTTDAYAIVEKYIPFQFTNIKFRIQNKLTEYSCEATCPQYVIGLGQGRGVIPFNIELTATTLQNLFNGNVTWAQTKQNQQQGRTDQPPTTAPSNASAAPNPTLSTGLTQALNKFQQELKNNGTYEYADQYNIVISHPEIANASIVPPTITDLKTKPMTDATTASQALGNQQSINTRAMTKSAIAGMSISQFIDMAVRNSDYIYKQQTKIINKDGKEVVQGGNRQAFAWYRIGVEAKPLPNGTDSKRNDQAYQITYEVAPYGINDIKSEYFPQGRFRGAQKKYSYWFTGENTSVINFEQDFNYLYYITINSRARAQVASRGTADYREVEKRLFAPNSPQSNQGLDDADANEPGANAADYLYSPADQARVKLTIIGDPAWIEQGEVWSGVRSGKSTQPSSGDAYFDAFLPDGTINFDAREALFELTFQKPADYNIDTGLMEVKRVNNQAVAEQTYIYKALTVTSYLSRGKFTQDLEGVLLVFPVAKPTPTADSNVNYLSRSVENQSAAETARLERLASAAGNIPANPDVIITDPAGSDDYAATEYSEDQTLLPPETPEGPTSSDEIGTITDYNDDVVIEP